MPLRRCLSLLLLVVLTACGGGGESGGGAGKADNPPAATPARIEIAPDTVVLTAALQEKNLVATVFDADGNRLAVKVEWTSSRPGEVSVDATGKLVATGTGGSAQITASIGNLKSPPLLAVHTQVPAGAVLLSDANISGQPEETTPGAAASFSNTYQVNLFGIAAPKIGDLIINTESKIVAGRVQSVSTSNGVHQVTLGLVPARQLFPNLNINEVIDLSHAEVNVPADIAAMYEMTRNGNTFSFTPKPGQIKLSAQLSTQTTTKQAASAKISARAASSGVGPLNLLSKDFALGPFACKAVYDGAAGTGSEVMALTLPPLFTVALNPKLDIVSTPANGLERFVLHSEPTVNLEVGVKALIAAELKASCEAEVLSIKIPVGGPMALIVGGVLPIGVGAELGGKFTVVNFGISGKLSAKTTGDVGVNCPGGANCGIVTEFGKLDVSLTPAIDMPSISDLRLEPSLSSYAFVKASIGNPFLKSLRFDAFKIKVGGALKGNFSTQGTQILDTAYQSDYKLVSEIKAGADTGFVGLAAFFGLNAFAETLLEISADIGGTPVGTITADTADFVVGQKTTFTVTLDPSKIDFIPQVGPYNVERVLLVRQVGGLLVQDVASISAQPGQTVFKFEVDPAAAHPIDSFYAFVVTKLLPSNNLSLELGQASAPSQAKASALALGSYHSCVLTNKGGVKCWGRNVEGQLGNGSLLNSTVPVDVVGLGSGVTAIASGDNQSCALTSNGVVQCWGTGILGNGLSSSSVPVAVTGLGSGVKAISMGGDFACAVTASGIVMCWGANNTAQLGNGNANSGKLGFTTPNILEEFPVNVTGPISAVAISSGYNFSCALSGAGSAKCWGYGSFGTYGSGSVERSYMPVDLASPGSIAALSAGLSHACALSTTGAVFCWGANTVGQLGDGPSTTKCAGPNVLCSSVPVPVTGLQSGVLAISAGSDRTCAISADGTITCWGVSAGGASFSRLPVLKTGLTGVQKGLDTGHGQHVCAINEGGGVQCWGDNFYGQLGNGSTVFSDAPVNVSQFP